MPRTFQDTLAYDADNVLLNADEFGESITHTTPAGASSTVVGVVDYDSLGTAQPTNENGTRIVQRALLELSADVMVTEQRQGGLYPSRFTIDGVVWLAIRIVGKDAATQTIEIGRVDQKASARP